MANKLEQSQFPVRNFSFYADTGLIEGIVLQTTVPMPSNNGRVYPPHVRCGEQFIALDRVIEPRKHTVDGKTMIFNANVREIAPLNNSAAFKTLAGGADSSALLLYVDTTPVFNPRIKHKYYPDAWAGVLAVDKAVSIIGDVRSGSALLQFAAEGQVALIFLRDGSVFEVVAHNRTLQSRVLPPDEAAAARVDQFEGQIQWLTDSPEDTRRLHGILGGGDSSPANDQEQSRSSEGSHELSPDVRRRRGDALRDATGGAQAPLGLERCGCVVLLSRREQSRRSDCNQEVVWEVRCGDRPGEEERTVGARSQNAREDAWRIR